MQNYLDEHWKTVKIILRYLKGTVNHGLTLKNCTNINLFGFAYADWATDPDDRRSTCGYCIYIGKNLISWCSKKQTTISRSSTETEYKSVANAIAELQWIKSLLSEFRINITKKATIWCDNLSTVSLTANPILHARTKHIELNLYFVREKVLQEIVEVNHLPSTYQRADIFTKALSVKNFLRLKQELNVDDCSNQQLKLDLRLISYLGSMTCKIEKAWTKSKLPAVNLLKTLNLKTGFKFRIRSDVSCCYTTTSYHHKL